MPSPPTPDCFRLDAKTVLAGIVLPAFCFVVDFLTGERVTSSAPAALLTLYALGSGALYLSATLDPRSAMSGSVAGALVAASIAACLITVPLTVLAVIAGHFGIISIRTGGLYFLGLSALGFGTLWTALVFVRRAHFSVGASVRARGPWRTLGLVFLGATVLGGAIHGADRLDRWWVSSQIAQISKSSPNRWPPILARLSAYPLCGRERCSKLVCDRLFLEFGSDTAEVGLYFPPQVPREHEKLLAEFVGGPTSQRCQRMD